MIHYSDVFDYITQQETNYKRPVPLNDAWSWSMADHIKTSFLYAHSQLLTGKDDFKPVKNITRPILNLQHRTEDIEAKDVEIYVDEPEQQHLSFLVKKYHDDVFVQENDIDGYFDALNISRIDYGGGLSKQLNKPCPEVVPLQTIAFCDQTDLLSGPIGIKHYYSPDQLLDMRSVGWGDTKNGATITVEDLIKLSREEKKVGDNQQTAQTPGRYIEVYEVHGNLPKSFFDEKDTTGEYETRIVICAFYQKKGSDGKKGCILYTAPEAEIPFKLTQRDAVHGRALGFGGAEELFEAQVWTNYDMIRIQGMLDAASKTILKAVGPNSGNIASRNKIRDLDNLEIIDVGTDSDLAQVDTFPRNMQLFERSVSQWEAHAQQMGAANDAIMGESPSSGTPFKLQELVVATNQGLHEYRRQQYARHLEEVYRDWIIPHIKKQILKGARFLSNLSVKELNYVADCVVRTETNKRVKEMVLMYGREVTEEEKAVFEDLVRAELKKKGNKLFIEILKGEFRDHPLAVKVSVAGKSKDLSKMTDKLTNIFRFVISNPQGFEQVLQMPGMADAFNQILEYSGVSPADFSELAYKQKTLPAGADATANSPVSPIGAPVEEAVV